MKPRLSLALLTGLLVTVAFQPAPLRGQAPADTIELEPLVVTVYGLPMPREAATAAVTVITGEQLRAQGIHHVLEALRSVPGAAIVQSGSFGSITSLFLRGGESDYVQVLVDGVPANKPGGAFDFAHLTTDNVERIEIVRGPASVLYGSDAVTGVVQIFTRRGRGDPRATVGIRGGTYGSVGWDAEFSGGNEVANYAFSLSRFATDGAYAFNNNYRNTVLSTLVRVMPDDRTEASLSLRYTDNESHVPTDGAGRLVDRNAFQLQDALTLGLEIGRFFTERFDARLRVAVNEFDGGFDDQPDDAADTLGFFAFRSLQDERRLSADARANVYLTPTTVLTAGAEIEQQKERSLNESESEFGQSSGSFEVERWNRAYYVQALAADVGGQLSLNAGARLEDNDAFGTFSTYRAGAAYRLPTGTRVRATVGTGFKEPTFFENFAAGFVRGNPELDPERSRSWEVGIDQSLAGGQLSLSATYFDQRFRDLIQFTFNPPERDEPNYFNVAGADAAGIELGLRLTTLGRLNVAANYTYLNTEVTDPGFETDPDAAFVAGDRLLRRPTRAANLNLGYRLPGRGTFNLDFNFVGERDDRDFSSFPARRVTLPSHIKVDLAAEYEFLRGRGRRPGVTATARVENLFNESYEEAKNFPVRGRTILMGATLSF
ncbi:MAG: TonB-dependent receptor [Gemmatimonadales bacterium]